jgi:glyoxylase-like metal-dependent hydrolase (beta-lactamase superfamily II)
MLTHETGYDIDILVQGYPGKSVCHGGLGWSSVVLLKGHGRNVLIDAGSFGMRRVILERLTAAGIRPEDVTDLLLTHSHYDHAVNWTLFADARICISKVELDWSLTVPWGKTPVPELYVEKLKSWPTVELIEAEQEVAPKIVAYAAPGHTPGCIVYVLEGTERDIIFTGDAAKNSAELVSRSTDMTYDPNTSSASIEMIWELWQRREGSIVVPGHDVPLAQEDGVVRKLGKHEAAIKSWFDNDLETTTLFSLTNQ